MRRKEELSFWEKTYVLPVIQGTFFTFGKLVKNLLVHILHALGLGKNLQSDVSISYPDERRHYPDNYRGRHRLTVNEDGSLRCTSCFLCATACPARCIYIEPAEHPNPEIEKFPHRYEIDTLLCIYCGYCVEACPVDAIRMDTGLHPEVYQPDPRNFIEDKEVLMQRSLDLQAKGKEKLFEEHLVRIRGVEANPNRVQKVGQSAAIRVEEKKDEKAA
jgi:NADH-quinone oxidoreductase subunit I